MTDDNPRPLNERVAALEAVQGRHDDDIRQLSGKIDNLERELKDGFAAVREQISASISTRSRIVTGSMSGGAALGGALAVGLYQLLHAIFPHFFGG